MASSGRRVGETEFGGVGGLIQPRAKGHRQDADRKGVDEQAMIMRWQGMREAAGLVQLTDAELLDLVESGKNPMA